jgi:hypothetical protein
MDIKYLSGLALAVALWAPGWSAAQTANGLSSKGVVYKCARPDGGTEYTNQPAAGCVVLFTFIPSEWRQIAKGGYGASSRWTLYVNEAWRNHSAEHAGTLVWIYDKTMERFLIGGYYKALAAHVSVDCKTQRLTLDHRTFYQDKPGGTALPPDDGTLSFIPSAESPSTAIVAEFCFR